MGRVRLSYYQVDAFAAETFGGNPAGVCLLKSWLPDSVLQKIAAENNLAETAFLVGRENFYELRWFTPLVEVDLCGHATLASAFVLFSELGLGGTSVRFQTRSGSLVAHRRAELIELDFPACVPWLSTTPDDLVGGLGRTPREVLKSRDFLAIYESEHEVSSLAPDMALLAKLDCLGVIVTAPGSNCDFVSRFFAPRAGIPEDPVTGSSHSTLIPYWAARLGKKEMLARQISKRGGELFCRHEGERVAIGGRAVIYSRAEIDVPE